MSKNIQYSHKRNLTFIAIILTSIFVFLNVTVLYISSNIIDNKISEETAELLLLTSNLINDNDLNVAFEYIEHYSESHSVEIEIYTTLEELIYTSRDSTFNPVKRELITDKGVFYLYIDNSHSVTIDSYKDQLINMNIVLLVIYIITLSSLLFMNKSTSNKIDKDITELSALIKSLPNYHYNFNYKQFDDIHKAIWEYIDEIDLLRDKRDINIKGLAHDIKTPLTIINSYIQHSSGGNKEVAISSVDEINDLVTELIDEKYINIFKKINITSIISETLTKFKSIFDSKDITITFNSKEDIYVFWSKKDFMRVLENLFSNAFYYADENSTFDISIINQDDITIQFQSSGSPMNQETIDNVFKKGYRGNISYTKNAQGKGLGLYICRLLLTPIQGRIIASSTGNNNIFKIKLKKEIEDES